MKRHEIDFGAGDKIMSQFKKQKLDEAVKGMQMPVAELDLFSAPEVQNTVTETYDTQHNPTSFSNAWSPSSVIEFKIDLAENEYMLLHETSLSMEILVTKKNAGTWTPADEAEAKTVWPVNNVLHSAIDRVQVKVGSSGTLIDITDYSYKAYMSTLFGFDDTAKRTHLKCAGWEPDDDKRRKMYVKELTEARMHLRGKLFYDFEHQSRAIMGGSRVVIKINLKSPKYFLQTKDGTIKGFGAELGGVHLNVKRYRVTDKMARLHQMAIQRSNARYPLTESRIKTAIIRSGSVNVNCDNLVTGRLPSRLIAGFVSKNSYTGALNSDPFEFKHFGFEEIQCYIDGVQKPAKPYTADFESGNFTDAYYNLFETLDQHDSATACDITMDDFKTKSFFAGFKLSADFSNGCSLGGYLNKTRNGHLHLQIKFNKPVSEDLYLIAFCEFDSVYELDEYKNLCIRNDGQFGDD